MTSKWETVRLGDVANIQQGKKVPLSPIGVDGYPVLGATGVIGSWHVPTYYEPRVALGCRGTVGNTRIIAKPAWFGNNVMAVWPKDEQQIDLKFLGHVISWTDLVAQGAVGGQVQKQITRTGLSPVRIPLPPLPEQRRIVDLIGALDDAIEAAEENNAMLHLARAAMAASATSDENATPIDRLAVVSQGKSLPKSVQGNISGEVPWYKIADMTSDDNMYGYNTAQTMLSAPEISLLKGRIVDAGSTVFPRVGAAVLTEKKRIVDQAGALDENHIILTPKSGVGAELLLAAMENIRLAELVRPGAVPSLNMALIKTVKLPWFSGGDLQELNESFQSLRQSLAAVDEHAKSLRALRTELLTALLSGAHEIPESYDSVMELASA